MATIERPTTASITAGRRQGEAARLRREEGLTNPQIALRMSVERSTVYRWLGSTPPGLRRRRHTQETKDRARVLRGEGLSNWGIALALSVGWDSIERWLGPTPRNLRKCRDYTTTELPSRAVYLREASGYSVTELAERMGVPRSTVGQWVKGIGPYGLLD